MKIIIPFIMFVLLMSLTFAAVGENTGVDAIFDEVGLEKPTEWSSWNKRVKFDYLLSRGIYPANGRNYEGKANIDGFFEWLGVEKPTNWDSLSVDQRKLFVEKIQYPEKFVENDFEEEESFSIFALIATLFAFMIVVGSFAKPKSNLKDYIREGIYYALPLILLVLVFLSPYREFFAHLGELAEKLLLFLLFVKPLAMITRFKFFIRAVAYRRESGIASFWFFIYHAAGLIFVRNLTTIANYKVTFLFWGLVAGIGMLILTATSNDESVIYFKKNWKRIQYIVYPVLFAVLAHSSLWANGDLIKFYVLGSLFVALKVVEFSGFRIKK